MGKKKIHVILLSVLAGMPIIIILAFVLFADSNVFSVFPSEKFNAAGWWSYSSEESSIHSFKTSSQKIEFAYTLNGSPCYAGFGVYLDQNYPFIDLSKYAIVTVKLSALKAKQFGVLISTFEKGITQLKDGSYTPLRPCQVSTEVVPNSDIYSIALSTLKVPDWWMRLYGVRGETLEPDPLEKSSMIQLFFDDAELLGQKDMVEVYEITFHVLPDFSWIIIVVGTVCYYLIFGSIFILPRIKRNIENNRIKLLSSYKRIEQISYWKKDEELVRSYITENYNDPDISLSHISTELGMSEKRIKNIIRVEYGMNFKSCITWLRIQEAKRLLVETDFNITEIAFRLGFNSNSYFGLIFKKHEGLSPREYKEKYGHIKM